MSTSDFGIAVGQQHPKRTVNGPSNPREAFATLREAATKTTNPAAGRAQQT
jgi:hypothetical protein